MKTIIAGSRDIVNMDHIMFAISVSGFHITEVVSGTARGVDRLGEEWAKANSVPVKSFPADWDRYGKSAGHRRNTEMALYADALIAVWDGVSSGTHDMILKARNRKLKVFIHRVR